MGSRDSNDRMECLCRAALADRAREFAGPAVGEFFGGSTR